MSEYIITCDDEVAMWVGNDVETMKRIVRCRDCIHYSGEDDEIYPKWCMEMNVWEVEPDGFCAWGERREQ